MASNLGATTYTWRKDVARLVRRYERRYSTKANTYVDHPTGWGLDAVSVDFWAPAGRGWDIDPAVGQRIFHRVRRRIIEPTYRWIIWQGVIYFPDGTARPYNDPNDRHFDHVHVTFW